MAGTQYPANTTEVTITKPHHNTSTCSTRLTPQHLSFFCSICQTDTDRPLVSFWGTCFEFDRNPTNLNQMTQTPSTFNGNFFFSILTFNHLNLFPTLSRYLGFGNYSLIFAISALLTQ